jgi:hypothetical protein
MRAGLKVLIIAPVVALAAACSKDKPVDPSLNSDLGLAAQAGTPLDSVTAAEQTKGADVMRSGTTASAPKTTSTTTRKSSSTATKSSGTSTASSSTSGTTATKAPTTTVEKHTKRDAAIGGAAGAIIGAATSKDKVKGAVIGGAAGAILGGVIGNNVDVKKTTKP